MQSRRGFTLIELSIVLVVIGLVVGGVLVGRDMIRAAEVRRAAFDFERFTLAISTFKVKYNCLPGDCANATAFFSDLATDQANNPRNGNGNDIYEYGAPYEGFLRVWEHLDKASLIPYGPYSGQYLGGDPGGPGVALGYNLPLLPWTADKITYNSLGKKATFVVTTNSFCTHGYSGCESFQPSYTDPINRTGKHRLVLQALTAIDHFTIQGVDGSFGRDLDMKIDDGLPLRGKLRAMLRPGFAAGECLDGTYNLQQIYRIDNGGPTRCFLAYDIM